MNKLKKRKLQLLALCTGFTGLTLGVLFFSGKGLGSFSPKVSADSNYILTLNSDNGGSSFSSSYSSSEQVNKSARTNKGSEIDITYSNVKKSTNNYAVVANSGYLFNSTRLTGLETVTVNFTGSLSIYTSSTTTFSGVSSALTSGLEFAVDANNDYFKLVSSGETTISSVVATYLCSSRQINYVKVTETSELTDGTYLIVNETYSKALNGGGSIESDIKTPQTVTISNNKIEATSVTDAYAVVIDINGDNSSILTTGGVYIGGVSNSNSTSIDNSPIANSISVSDGVADIVSDTSHLRYNATGVTHLFRYYKATSYSSMGEIALYKRDSGSVPVDPVDPSGDNPTTETYVITVEKANNELDTSASSDTTNVSYVIGETGNTFDIAFSAGAYNMSNYNEFRLNNSSLTPTNNILVKSIWIDFYGSSYSYLAVSANGNAVTGTASSTSGSGSAYDYEINSTVWKLEATSGYSTIYSIKFTVEVQVGPVSVTGLELNKDSLSIYEGSNETLVATVSPINATDKTVTWSSSDSTVATVLNGVVSAVAPGTAIITATTTDGGFEESCTVTVLEITHVGGVSLNKTELHLNPGITETLVATVTPNNATNKNIVWSSGNENIATVSEGVVTAVSAGATTITATTEDGGFSASCAVTVTNVSVSGVELNKTNLTITRLGSETLYATVSPSNATNKNVTWTTSNSNVATVANGTVTGVSAGTATITVSTVDGNKTATCNVTVNPIGVTSVTLNQSLLNMYVGNSETLVPTINPSNADNTNVTWSTGNESVATVSNGVVTAVGVGSTTITVTTVDGGKTASCNVSVSEQPDSTFIITSSSFGNSYSGSDGSHSVSDSVTSETMSFESSNICAQSSKVQFRANPAGYIYNTTSLVLNTLTISGYTSGDVTVYAGNTSHPTSNAITDSNGEFDLSGYSFFTILGNGSTHSYSSITITTGVPVPVDPDGISLPATESMSLVGTKTLEVTYSPANCNQNKGVTWSSSNTTIATINSTTGVITPKKAGTTVITATSTFNANFTSSCTLTVTDNMDEWTILMYVCGANLESDYASSNEGSATEDLAEIAQVSGQPSDVNVVVQAGGASKWSSTYSNVINKDYANRFHLRNKAYVKDEQITKVDMGVGENFQDFLEWGITTYPAQKIGVILWDHGGAMDGCCYDEQFSDEPLTPLEVHDAIVGAKEATGYTSQFEFVGYDCCLMQVQDIASLNAEYAKYQVASEESEWGYGWTYNEWIDDLFAKKSTSNILKAIVDSFGSETTACYTEWQKEDPSYVNDQTLSYLDLTKWATYQTAFENVAATLTSVVNTTSKWNTFKNYVNQAQKYGQVDLSKYPSYSTYNNGYIYDIFDVGGVITSLKSGYSGNSTLVSQLNTLETAYNSVIGHEWHGEAAGNSTGMTLFCPVSGYNESSYYGTSGMTNLTTWQSFVVSLGNWY